MARKPNYDFERREREKLKAEKAAQKKAAKKAKDPEEQAASDPQGAGPTANAAEI